MIRWCTQDSPHSPATAACPTCGSLSPKRRVLVAPTASGPEVTLLACNACGAHFFTGLAAGNYGDQPVGGAAALTFYVQQGADLGGIAMRLITLGRPAGTRYLEIGCGFGFGLDIARRGLGWEVTGIDPSPLAAAGRDMLGLPIELRYFGTDDDLRADYDVIHASEFLEHVADPPAILRSVRAALRSGGTLLLTTPAAEMIRPDTSEGLLIPLLSIGWHLVIQSVQSLTILLYRAGFTDVQVERHGAQLVAYAGDPTPRGSADRQPYRDWLAAAAASAPAESDLAIGLRARLFREYAGSSAFDAADGAWSELDAAVRTRYGRDLKSWCSPAAALEPDLPLIALAEKEPLCLAGVLLMQGLSELQCGGAAEPFMAGAFGAARRLRNALRAIGSDDGDAEDVGFIAERELIVYAADRGETGLAARLLAFERRAGPKYTEGLRRRCFVPLVNRGALDDARQLLDVIDAPTAALERRELLDHADASIVFCAATLELQTPGGRLEAAMGWLRSLRRGLLQAFLAGRTQSATALFWPAVDAEALGFRLCGREQDAAGLVENVAAQVAPITGFPSRPPA